MPSVLSHPSPSNKKGGHTRTRTQMSAETLWGGKGWIRTSAYTQVYHIV